MSEHRLVPLPETTTTTTATTPIGQKRLVPSDSPGFLEEQVWTGSAWRTIDFVRDTATSGSGTRAPTQFESQRQLDLAQAKATLQNAQAALQNAQTSRDQLKIQRAQLELQKAQLAFDKAQTAIENQLSRDRLNAEIAATKQRLEEIRLESELAFKNEDALLTKRLEAEREMLELRLDNDFRQLLFSEIGAERRTLIQEQGETRRLSASLQGKDPFRQGNLLAGQAQRGRTPAARFGQENQAFLNQPLPQVNFNAPFPTGGAGTGDPAIRAQALAALQQQLTGAQQRPLQPQAPVAGLAQGGTFSMRGPPQSFLVGEGAGVIPGITEIMTVGGGKVTISPLMGGFQEGGTVFAPLEGTVYLANGKHYLFHDGKVFQLQGDVSGTAATELTSEEATALLRFGFSSVNISAALDAGWISPPAPEPTIGIPPGGNVTPIAPTPTPTPTAEPIFTDPITDTIEPIADPGGFIGNETQPTSPQLIRFSDSKTVYYWDANLGVYRDLTSLEVFQQSGLVGGDNVTNLDPAEREATEFGPPITEAFDPAIGPSMPNLIRFEDDKTVYIWNAEAQAFQSVGSLEIFQQSGLSGADVVNLDPSIRERFTFLDDPLIEPFDETTDPRLEPPPPPVVEPPPPVVEPPPPVVEPPPPSGPSQQDILAGLQALAPGFAGLSEFVPRTQTGPFGGTQAMRDFFSFQGQNLVQDPFSGQFRPFLPGLPEGTTPQALLNAPTSFGAPVVNQGAFNLQNLATLGFDPALVRLGGQEDIFYRDPTTGELRQFGTPDIFEQSGFNLADVFNISPTGQQFNFGAPITSPLPLAPNANTVGPFRMPLIDPLTGALLFDPFQNASSLLQLFQENPTSFNNLLSSFGTAGLDPAGFQSRLDLATPTGRLDNPQRIGFRGAFL